MKANFWTALLFILTGACNAPGGNMTANKTSDLENVGQKLELKLPQGTEILGLESEAGIDDSVRAKLRIPSAYAADFLRDCGVKRFRQGGANLLGPNHGFWDPHSAKALRAGETTLASGRSLLIAVDESSTDAVIVYAINYST